MTKQNHREKRGDDNAAVGGSIPLGLPCQHKSCPFCGVPVIPYPEEEAPLGEAKYWLKVTHKETCWISMLGFGNYPILIERAQAWNTRARDVDRQLLCDIGFKLGSGWDHEVWVYDGMFYVHFGQYDLNELATAGNVDGDTINREEFFGEFAKQLRESR